MSTLTMNNNKNIWKSEIQIDTNLMFFLAFKIIDD